MDYMTSLLKHDQPVRLLSLIYILLFVSFASLYGQNTENVDPRKGRVSANPASGNRYSIEQEIQLGQQAAAAIEKEMTLVPANDPSSRYLNNLGQKLGAVAPGDKFPYTFKLVREQSINAPAAGRACWRRIARTAAHISEPRR